MTIDIRVLGIQQYQLLNDIEFKSSKYLIRIYKGFIYDGASIPSSLWDDVGCPIDFAFESAIHDGLYRSRLLTRKECDKVFYEALIYKGVSKPKALAMYLAVRAGGEQAYDDAKYMMAHYRNYVQVMPR